MKNLIKLFSILLLFSFLSNLKGCEYPAGSSKEDAERKVTLETITIVSHVTEFNSQKSKYQRLIIGIPFDTDGGMREINEITGDEFHYEIPLKAIIGDHPIEILISYRDKDGNHTAKFPVSFFKKHFHLAKSKNLIFIATINSSGELDLIPDPTSDSEAGDSKGIAEKALESITIVSNIKEDNPDSTDKFQTLEVIILYNGHIKQGPVRWVTLTGYGITRDEFHYKIPLKTLILNPGDKDQNAKLKIHIISRNRSSQFPLSFFEERFHLAKSKNLNFIATINSSGELDLIPDPTSDIRKLKEQSENNQQGGAQSEKDAGNSAADNINLPHNDPDNDDDFDCVIL